MTSLADVTKRMDAATMVVCKKAERLGWSLEKMLSEVMAVRAEYMAELVDTLCDTISVERPDPNPRSTALANFLGEDASDA